jgi:hypothetical protein
MARIRLAPSTVIALVGVLAIASCDPCDPCDGKLERSNTAGPALEQPGSLEPGALATG